MSKKILFLLVFLLTTVTAEARPPTGVSLDSRDWQVKYGAPAYHPEPSEYGTGWKLNFPVVLPDDPVQSINYVTTKRFPRLQQGQTLSLDAVLIAAPGAVFRYGYETPEGDPCGRPANFRFYFNKGLSNRWWSTFVEAWLVPGNIHIEVPLMPDQWSNVYGQMGNGSSKLEKSFAGALRGAKELGMTFGGGCFFGHGVWMEQKEEKATIYILNYEVK